MKRTDCRSCPRDDFLLGICFCAHCLARARVAGVDVQAAQMAVAGLLDAAFARELPQSQFPGFPTEGIAAFARIPALHDYLFWRSEPVTSLIGEIKAVVPAGVRLLLIDFEGSWWGGVDVAAVAPHVDGLLYCAYFTAVDRIADLMTEARQRIGPGKKL